MSESVSELSLEEEIVEEEEEEVEEEEHKDQPLEEEEEEVEGSELKEEDDSDNDELEFPDTAVSVQASSKEGGGLRLQVQRVDSTVSVEDSEATPLNVS